MNMTSIRVAVVVLLSLLLLTSGCGSLNERYVQADRATFNAVGARMKKYIDADPSLSELQKKNRKNTIDSWDARVTEAERFLKMNPEPDDGSIWFGWGRNRR